MLLIQYCSNITLQVATSICFNPVFAVAAYMGEEGGAPLENWGYMPPGKIWGATGEKVYIL